MKTTRVEWSEIRRSECGGSETVFVIAERESADVTGWSFYERSSWDILWVRYPATLCRVVRAEILEAARLISLRNPIKTSRNPPVEQQRAWPPNRREAENILHKRCCIPRAKLCVLRMHVNRRVGRGSSSRPLVEVDDDPTESEEGDSNPDAAAGPGKHKLRKSKT